MAAQLAQEHRVHQGMRLELSPPGLAGAKGRAAVSAFTAGVLLLAVLVLLAASFNLAGHQIARGLERSRELAIRLSIGADRGRITRQLITESLVLAACGGSVGLTGAAIAASTISQWQPIADFPIRLDITADWRVFLAGLAAVAFTGVLVGAGVARRAWTTDPAVALKGGGETSPVRRFSLQDCLLGAQIALCCLLVLTSLAAARGLTASLHGRFGLRPDGVAFTSYDLHAAGYDAAQGAVFHQRVLESVAALPGVESAAFGNSVPLSPDHSTSSVYPVDTTEFTAPNAIRASTYRASPGYFVTLGTRLVTGRDFTVSDGPRAPKVAIVNQTLAKRVGSRFLRGSRDEVEIVGVVEDGKYESLTEDPTAAVFYPILQDHSQEAVLIARSARPESELASEMRRVVARHDANLAVFGTGSLRHVQSLAYLPMRAAGIALGAFGLLALMLAVTGIYGMALQTVARRTREIGILMALGARPGQTLEFVFGRLGKLMIAGVAIGLALGAATTSVLESVVYRASPSDPLLIAIAILCMVLVAALATWGPAQKAIRLDPVRSIRQS